MQKKNFKNSKNEKRFFYVKLELYILYLFGEHKFHVYTRPSLVHDWRVLSFCIQYTTNIEKHFFFTMEMEKKMESIANIQT